MFQWQRLSSSTSIALALCVGCDSPMSNLSIGRLPRDRPSSEELERAAPSIEALIGTLNSTSTPTDVAKVALECVSQDDQASLFQLVAKERVNSDVVSLTGGRVAFQKFIDHAQNNTTQSIALRFAGMEMPFTFELESIQGSQATVTVSGNRSARPVQQKLFLHRENDMWLLVPSHR